MNYLKQCVSDIVEQTDLDEDQAQSLMMSVADSMAEEGVLPPMPEDEMEMNDEGIDDWEKSAQGVDLGNVAMAVAMEMDGGEDDDDDEMMGDDEMETDSEE